MTDFHEVTTMKFKLSGRFKEAKKNPGKGLGWGRVEVNFILQNSGAKYLFGIGDQTLDTAKGLEAIPSDITIGTCNSNLNRWFVNLCKSS